MSNWIKLIRTHKGMRAEAKKKKGKNFCREEPPYSMCKLLRKSTYQRRRLPMAYHCSILFPFVSMSLRSTQATGHTARSKALTMLLQGLLVFRQASLSGMGRGVAVVYEEESFRGQLKEAHRLKPRQNRLCWLTLCGTPSQPTFFL
jgi:hypothetical protein